MIFGVSTPSLLLGQQGATAAAPRYTVRPYQGGSYTRMVRPGPGRVSSAASQTGKASASSKFNWQQAAGHSAVTLVTRAATLGMGILGAVYTYDALLRQNVPSRVPGDTSKVSRIEAGAQDFGTGYGYSLPYGYQTAQAENLPRRMTLYEEEQLARADIDQQVYEYKKSIEIPSTTTQKATQHRQWHPTIL